jgi:hypothetical protein
VATKTRAPSPFLNSPENQVGELADVPGAFDFTDPKTNPKSLLNGQEERNVSQRIPFRYIVGTQARSELNGFEEDVVKN